MFASFEEIYKKPYMGENTKQLLLKIQQTFATQYPGELTSSTINAEIAKYLDATAQPKGTYDLDSEAFYSSIMELFELARAYKPQAVVTFSALIEFMTTIKPSLTIFDYADFCYALKSMHSFTKFLPKTDASALGDFELVCDFEAFGLK